MAIKTVQIRISDISGTELAEGDGETITFTVGSNSYSMDVSAKEAEKFYSAVKPYTDAATKVSGRGVRRTGARPASNAKIIKEWAATQGLPFPERGRLPQSLVDAYEAAH